MTVKRGRAVRVATLLTGLALAASACGDGGSSTPAAGPGSPASSASSSASAAGNVTTAGVGPDEQLVRVVKYGVGFGLPKSWFTLDAQSVLERDNPVVKQVSKRMGTPRKQLVKNLSGSVQTLSITDEGADHGFIDNVDSVGVPRRSFTDDQIKQELAGIGAKTGPFRHLSSPAGDVTVVGYYWRANGKFIFGQLLAIDVGKAAVSITVSSSNPDRAYRIAQEVQQTLQRL
jgi:hypothetical protein